MDAYTITLTDPELLMYLEREKDDVAKQRLVLSALRVGLLTLHGARGEVDKNTLFHIGERFSKEIADKFAERQALLDQQLTSWFSDKGPVSQFLMGEQDRLKKLFCTDSKSSPAAKFIESIDALNHQMLAQWSLDVEDSIASRLVKKNQSLMQEHIEQMSKLVHQLLNVEVLAEAKREESLKGTRHGVEFEDALNTLLEKWSHRNGHIHSKTGTRAGLIKECKVGDAVIELSVDHFASGAQIAIEAKQSANYDLKKILDECAVARKNRGADSAIFVLSSKRAHPEQASMVRYGNDLVVVWDSEDEATDLTVEAALSVASYICSARRYAMNELPDAVPMQEAVYSIEKELECLDDMVKYTSTIRNNSEKILNRVPEMRQAIQKNLAQLNEGLLALSQAQVGLGIE